MGEIHRAPLTGTLTIDSSTGLFSAADLRFVGQDWPNILAQGNRAVGGYFLDVETTTWNTGCFPPFQGGCLDVLHLFLSKSPLELIQSAAGLILAGSFAYHPDGPFANESRVDGTLTMVTPLPGAVVLFGSGLGLLGLLTWRRKRKAQAAAA